MGKAILEEELSQSPEPRFRTGGGGGEHISSLVCKDVIPIPQPAHLTMGAGVA